MKAILLATVWILLGSCNRQKLDVVDCRDTLRQKASMIHYMENGLAHTRHPGEIALATERIREAKAELDKLRAEFQPVISMEESAAIVQGVIYQMRQADKK